MLSLTEHIELAVFLKSNKVAGKINEIYANELTGNTGNIWNDIEFSWMNGMILNF